MDHMETVVKSEGTFVQKKLILRWNGCLKKKTSGEDVSTFGNSDIQKVLPKSNSTTKNLSYNLPGVFLALFLKSRDSPSKGDEVFHFKLQLGIWNSALQYVLSYEGHDSMDRFCQLSVCGSVQT